MTYIKQNLRTKRDECFTNINGVEFYYFKNGNNYSFHKVIDNIFYAYTFDHKPSTILLDVIDNEFMIKHKHNKSCIWFDITTGKGSNTVFEDIDYNPKSKANQFFKQLKLKDMLKICKLEYNMHNCGKSRRKIIKK